MVFIGCFDFGGGEGVAFAESTSGGLDEGRIYLA